MKFAVFLFLVCLHSALTKHLPQPLRKCDLSDPNFETCLATAIQDSIIALKDGNKAYGVPPLVPLEIEKMVIGEGTGPVKVVQNLQNLKISGITSIHVLKASYDLKTNILEVTITFSVLTLKADYKMDGNILVLPIKGHGPCEITLVEPVFQHKFHFKDVTKNGKTYLQIEKHDIDIRPKKMKFDFQNLFDGNEQLSKVLLQTVNDNWEEVFNDVKAGYEASIGSIFTVISNRFFGKIPKEEVFS